MYTHTPILIQNFVSSQQKIKIASPGTKYIKNNPSKLKTMAKIMISMPVYNRYPSARMLFVSSLDRREVIIFLN